MNMGDPKAFVEQSARLMLAQQKSLAGKVEDASRAQQALRETAHAITTHANEHADWAYSASSDWTGKSAEGFDRRSGRVGKSLAATADAAGKGAGIVDSAHRELAARHEAVGRLIDEYVRRATPILDAANKADLAGARGTINNALGEVLRMRDEYTRESTKHLAAAQTNLKDAARKLRDLEGAVKRDGFADPNRKRRSAGSAGSVTRPQRSDRPSRKPAPVRSRTQPAQPGPAPVQPRPEPVAPRPKPAPDRSDDRERRPRPETPPRRADPNPNEGRQRPGISPEPESRSDAAQGYDIPRGGPFSREYPRARPPGR